jgi:arylsulfatase A-like enzyme
MRNGVTHTILERERLTLAAVTLPQVLAQKGYISGVFGKWHLGDEDSYQPQNRGFDEVFIHGAGGIGQAYPGSCADVPDNSYFGPVIRHNGKFVRTRGYCTDVFFQATLHWIARRKDEDEPFFAYLATNAPHSPYHAPSYNVDRFKSLGFGDTQAGFYGMIENIDENVGRLIAKLNEWELMEETVIVFMSDNGMAGDGAGPIGETIGRSVDGLPLTATNAGMRGLKGSVHEGGLRVPFFIRFPNRAHANKDVNRVVAHIDVFPTIASLAGAEIPEKQVEGRNLLPLIENPEGEWRDRYLFTHAGRWPKDANPSDHQWNNFSVRSQRFRLVNDNELYDMAADPGQETNVIKQHPEVAGVMIKAYEHWWRATRPMMVNESAPLSETRPFQQAFRRQEVGQGIQEWPARLTGR